jgi:hypothetical protein
MSCGSRSAECRMLATFAPPAAGGTAPDHQEAGSVSVLTGSAHATHSPSGDPVRHPWASAARARSAPLQPAAAPALPCSESSPSGSLRWLLWQSRVTQAADVASAGSQRARRACGPGTRGAAQVSARSRPSEYAARQAHAVRERAEPPISACARLAADEDVRLRAGPA